MSMYQRKLHISLPWAIAIIFLFLVFVFIAISISMTEKKILEPEGPGFVFISGLVPGLAVALIQFLLSWTEFKQISRFSAMKIKGVLSSRDEEAYYCNLINSAQTRIEVFGVTAQRFVRDFADDTSSKPERKVLLKALDRDVVVRILVAEKKYLSQADADYKFPVAQRAFLDLVSRYPALFEVRYFSHTPIASIVSIDEDVLVGPIFQNRESRNTPAIHTSSGSMLAQSYLSHFEDEWNQAMPLKV
jgi:hypothetical protein